MADLRYPLHFPTRQPRTPTHKRNRAQFQVTFAKARDELLAELQRLGATGIIISTNIELRQDGLPYANRREPDDSGVAVYFDLKKKPHVLACDKWDKTKDNVRAIGLHVAAMRGMERWGVGSVEQAFMGYQCLPEYDPNREKEWWEILGVSEFASVDEIRQAFIDEAKSAHPDKGGTHDRMTELNRAYRIAKQVKGFSA
jgi:hypothetical protein